MARHRATNSAIDALGRALAAGLATTLLGCGWSDERSGEWYSHWDKAGGCQGTTERTVNWVNGFGEPVDACAFPGEYVWVTYAALWCQASEAQAPRVVTAMRHAGSDMRFITTLTGGAEVFTAATSDDARRWADRFGLERAMTVTEGVSSRTIPQHALIGPDGRTWFRYVGSMSAEDITGLLSQFRSGQRLPPQ